MPDDQFSIDCGVLQGDPLSPLLFAFCIRGLPKRLQSRKNGTSVIMYADDLVIISKDRKELRRARKICIYIASIWT